MRTHQQLDEMGRLRGFEVSSLLGRRLMRRIAASIPSARIASSNLRQERFCEFEVAGDRFAIEEPFGDNSRYWVGPADERQLHSVAIVHAHFAANKTGTWAVRIGAVLCCGIVVVAAYQPLRRFIDHDRCLDAGGKWSSAGKCEGSQRGG